MIRKSMGVQPMAGGSRGVLVELDLRWVGYCESGGGGRDATVFPIIYSFSRNQELVCILERSFGFGKKL